MHFFFSFGAPYLAWKSKDVCIRIIIIRHDQLTEKRPVFLLVTMVAYLAITVSKLFRGRYCVGEV
jgi:2-hydroxychromene-2-carboxylate isomerase